MLWIYILRDVSSMRSRKLESVDEIGLAKRIPSDNLRVYRCHPSNG